MVIFEGNASHWEALSKAKLFLQNKIEDMCQSVSSLGPNCPAYKQWSALKFCFLNLFCFILDTVFSYKTRGY